MMYPDPFKAELQDTHTVPISHLLAATKWLATGHWSFEKNLHNAHGPDGVKLFARAVRARVFRDHIHLGGYYRALLTRLDPPPCRCGKPGTRLIGSITFCEKCGPPPGALHTRAEIWKIFADGQRAYAADHHVDDRHAMQMEQLRRCKRPRRNR